MTVKISRKPRTDHPYPVELSIIGNDVRYLSDSELADLYIALTDYYADNGDN